MNTPSPVCGIPGRLAPERGASMVELIVVVPFLLLLGLGTVQLGLIYHGNTILNYATFEAARTGAVNHALPEPMRRELAVRLAPLVGGDGSTTAAARAIARSIADMERTTGIDGGPRPRTSVEVTSPPVVAFEDWGVTDPVSGRRVIPNSHLRHRESGRIGERSNLSLADANLLEIEVVHGLELKVPVVGPLLTAALTLADPGNAAWYAAGRLPLRSSATVRMQSDVWLAEAEPVAAAAPDGEVGEASGGEAAPAGDSPNDEPIDADASGEGDAPADACGEHGLGGGILPVSESAYASGECAVGTGDYEPGGLPPVLDGGGDASSDPSSSPLC